MYATIDLSGNELRDCAARFQRSLPRAALLQIATTIVPLIGIILLMHVGVANDWWAALLLGPAAAALTVRTFIIQHDCGHGSFLPGRTANDMLGRLCSLLTLTPFLQWRRQHAQHHGSWNDLDRRDGRSGDIYSTCLTVAEYLALEPLGRFRHRLLRHPVVSLLLLPPVIFLVLYRFPQSTPRSWRAERWSVYLTNFLLLLLHGTLALFLGVLPVMLVLLAVMLPASIVGVWLFSLQHHFEGTFWARHAEWDPVKAAIVGSSFLQLPRVLQWLTGSIGFHHIHHLAPRVPNYRLEECHRSHPAFENVAVLTLRKGLRAQRHALWDEQANRMVTFADVAAATRH